jgi:hypothetical protein
MGAGQLIELGSRITFLGWFPSLLFNGLLFRFKSLTVGISSEPKLTIKARYLRIIGLGFIIKMVYSLKKGHVFGKGP